MTVSLPNFPDHSPEIHKDGQGTDRVAESCVSTAGRKTMSRREVFSSIAATPLIAIGASAVAAGIGAMAIPAAASDPIFSLIERHRKADEYYGSVCPLTDNVAARNEGRVMTDRDIEIVDAAAEAEGELLDELLTTPPQTIGGVLAILKYLKPIDYDYDHMERALETLVKSPVFANV